MARKCGIGSIGFFSIAFGSVIGAGWLTVLGFWLSSAGPLGAILAFAVACVLTLLVALAYMELAAMLPVTGGEIAYTQLAFGSRAAFWSGWMLILLYVVYVGFLIIAAEWMFGNLVPAAKNVLAYRVFGGDTYAYELGFGIAVACALAIINIRGAKVAVSFQSALTLMLVLIWAIIVFAGLTRGQVAHLQPLFAAAADSKLQAVVVSAALVLPFYSGFNFVSQAMGERSDAVSTYRAAGLMAASVLCAFLFYGGIILSSASLVARDELLAFDLPVAEIFRIAFSLDWLATVMMCAGLAAIITSWNGAVFAGGRVVATMAQLKLLPGNAGAGANDERMQSAGFWLITAAGILLGLGGREIALDVIALGTLSLAVAWCLTSLSALRLRTSGPAWRRPLRVRCASLLFPLGSLAPLVLLLSLAMQPDFVRLAGIPLWVIVGSGWAIAGAVLWHVTRPSRDLLGDDERNKLLLTSIEG